ncbi:hypothetical protein KKA33_03100 [Patescibacteria group bacterium]|nr:hypothetical protein [Patescibacteria group bacterium]
MISILKEFGRGQVTLPKKWRERFNTNIYIAKDTSQGLLIVPLEDDSIKVDESKLKDEAGAKGHTGIFRKKTIRDHKS